MLSRSVGFSVTQVTASIPAPGAGATTYWTGAAGDGLWANANNWTGGQVPNMARGATITNAATITIANGDNTDWVLANSADAVVLTGGLLNTPALISQGATPLQVDCSLPATGFGVNGPIIVGGNIAVTNGGWNQSGNITIVTNGSIAFLGSPGHTTMAMTGHLINNGGSILINGGQLVLKGDLINNSGTVTASGGSIYVYGLYTAGTINLDYGYINSTNGWNVIGDTTVSLTQSSNKLYVTASTNNAWSGNVSIVNWTGEPNRILIGHTRLEATPTQLASITFVTTNGVNPAYLSSYGYVLPNQNVTILAQPASITTNAASSVSFVLGYSCTSQPLLQWLKDGNVIHGATNAVYALSSVSIADAGNYSLRLNNSTITNRSHIATLTVLTTTIVQQPVDQLVPYGNTLELSVVVTNANNPIMYQWSQAGQSIAGATSPTFSKTNASIADQGDYTVAVASPSGNVTSTIASVIIGPIITQQPQDMAVNYGDTANFSVAVNGSEPLVYQWLHDGYQIPGATSTNLVVSDVETTNSGNYAVVVSNPAGSVTSASALARLKLTISSATRRRADVHGFDHQFEPSGHCRGHQRHYHRDLVCRREPGIRWHTVGPK